MVIHQLNLQLGTPIRHPDVVFLRPVIVLRRTQPALRIEDLEVDKLDGVHARRFPEDTKHGLMLDSSLEGRISPSHIVCTLRPAAAARACLSRGIGGRRRWTA